MIVINGKQIIDIQHKNGSLKTSVCDYFELYKQDLDFIGAHEINTGDTSDYSLIINKKQFDNIEILQEQNEPTSQEPNYSDIKIENNKVFFNKSGNTSITLKYKHIEKNIDVNVKDVVITLLD